MHVAVCIVTYRNPADVARCLAALEKSTHADFEVILCENGGAQAFATLLEAVPTMLAGGQPVRAIQASGNLGYGGGVNVCLAATPAADAWWVLNPDTSPYPGAMGAQVARLERGDCHAVGCTLHLPGGEVQSYGGYWQPWLARAVSIGHGGRLEDRPDPAVIEAKQNYLNGASMMIGPRFLDIVGPMREDYFLYAEEVEWCLRGGQLGMRLGFAPDALVLHFQGTSTGNAVAVAKKARAPTYLTQRNAMLLTRDRFPGRFLVVALLAVPIMMLRYPRRGAWRQLGYSLAGWAAGLGGERGVPTWLAA